MFRPEQPRWPASQWNTSGGNPEENDIVNAAIALNDLVSDANKGALDLGCAEYPLPGGLIFGHDKWTSFSASLDGLQGCLTRLILALLPAPGHINQSPGSRTKLTALVVRVLRRRSCVGNLLLDRIVQIPDFDDESDMGEEECQPENRRQY